MAWFKVDDSFHAHPKLATLEGSKCFGNAVALWVIAGSWSASQLTDGAIPMQQLRKLVPFSAPNAARELVRAGLWDATENGYQFRGWTDYQPTRAQVEQAREKTRGKVAKWRERKGAGKAACNPVTEPPCNPVTEPVTNRSRNQVCNPAPDPTRPDPIDLTPHGVSSPRAPAREAHPLPEAPPDVEPSPAPGQALHSAYVAELTRRAARFDTLTAAKLDAARVAEVELERTAELRNVTPESLLKRSLERWFTDPFSARCGYSFTVYAKQAVQLAIADDRPKKQARTRGSAPPATRDEHAKERAEALENKAEGGIHGDIGI